VCSPTLPKLGVDAVADVDAEADSDKDPRAPVGLTSQDATLEIVCPRNTFCRTNNNNNFNDPGFCS
jgi:hypothetical protein